jgi:hypothetical protein
VSGLRAAPDPVVRVSLKPPLGEYDLARQAFPFRADQAGSIIPVPGPGCGPSSLEAPSSFWLDVELPPSLLAAGLPVAPDVAERLLGQSRPMSLDLLLSVSPEAGPNPTRPEVTVLDARVREPDGSWSFTTTAPSCSGPGPSSLRLRSQSRPISA